MSDTVEKDKKSGKGGWLFLLATVLVYGLIYFKLPEYGKPSFDHFVKMAIELAPILVLVFLFLWMLELVEGASSKLAKLAGRGSGITGWFIAISGGILSHGPVYAWYPLLQEMQKKGMRTALIAAFLYARSIKLPWLPLMAFYFGTAYMLVLTFFIALFSIVNGFIVERLVGVNNEEAE